MSQFFQKTQEKQQQESQTQQQKRLVQELKESIQ
jgi:hypothetical protein